MTCRAKGSAAVEEAKPLGCTGSTVSGRCLKGGAGGAAGGLGVQIPEQEFDLQAPEALMPLEAQSLCQLVFKGMRDSEDPQTENPEYARLIQNAYPIDSGLGARVIGRPGFAQIGAQLGTGSTRRVQGFYQFTKLAGTEYTICIAGGKFYTLNWTTSTWTEDTPAAATISTTAICYFVTIGDKVVISDGVNTPWTWDGADDAVLTNCPVLYGQPTVYYAKLFGIKNTERSTIVWSIENDPTTGYEAGGYNNAWTLGQTDQDPLFGIRGTNEALYYWRERSIGSIRGAVDADFVNSGTREGVSQTVGTKSPDGIVVGPDDFYFMDADGKPRSLSIGGGRLDDTTWRHLRETIPDFDETQLGDSRAVYDQHTNLVLLGCVLDSSTECDRYIAIDVSSGEIAGIWLGWTSTSMGVLKNASSVPVILHGTNNGNVYLHGLPTGSTWNDVSAAADGGTAAISHKVTGSHLGSHMYLEKKFLRWDVSVWAETDMALTLTYQTQRGTPTAQTKTVDLSSFPVEYHIAVGLNGEGRWIMPSIAHANGSERFGLERWCVRAVVYGEEPDIP